MITATGILVKALNELHLTYSFIDSEETFLQIHFPHGKHFIINNVLGIISNSDEKIAKDKAYQYLLLKDTVSIPKTNAYVDPQSKYAHLAQFKTNQTLCSDILSNFIFPFVIKKNQGSEGIHVFKVMNQQQIEDKINTIFNQNSSEYDFVLLAQEYIEPRIEFRVIIYNRKMHLAYAKDVSNAVRTENLSPLHWENAHALPISISQRDELENFVRKLFTVWPIKYAGLDIIEDKKGKLWLIEVNSAPSFAYYIRNNGDSKVVKMFTTILSDLKEMYG